jgi:hypothetical protein
MAERSAATPQPVRPAEEGSAAAQAGATSLEDGGVSAAFSGNVGLRCGSGVCSICGGEDSDSR